VAINCLKKRMISKRGSYGRSQPHRGKIQKHQQERGDKKLLVMKPNREKTKFRRGKIRPKREGRGGKGEKRGPKKKRSLGKKKGRTVLRFKRKNGEP